MATNNDMRYLQVFNGIVNYTEQILIRMNYHIGNIALHKNGSWQCIGNLRGWNPAVGTTYP